MEDMIQPGSTGSIEKSQPTHQVTQVLADSWVYAFGRACCAAWLLLQILHTIPPFGYEAILVFATGIIVSYLVMGPFARILFTDKNVLTVSIISASLCIIGFLLLSLASGKMSPLGCDVLIFVLGLGSGALYCLGGVVSSALNSNEAPFFPIMVVFFEALIVVGALSLFRAEAIGYVLVILPIITTATILPRSKPDEGSHRQRLLLKTRQSDIRSLLQSSCAIMSTELIFGIVIGLVVSDRFYFWALILGMFCAVMLKFFDCSHKNQLTVNFIIKVQAPIACAMLLFADILPPNALFAVVLIAAFLTSTCRIIFKTVVSNYMRVFELNPISNMSFINTVIFVGFVIGFCVSILMMRPEAIALSGRTARIILNVVVFVIVLLQAFVFRDNYRPFVEHNSMAEIDQSPEGADGENGPRSASWDSRCKAFAAHYGLTPRQTETLLLVAKGYSTAYIMEALCVTSHTAKAHLFAIYQKTDVHSRQKLIELIEDFEPEN